MVRGGRDGRTALLVSSFVSCFVYLRLCTPPSNNNELSEHSLELLFEQIILYNTVNQYPIKYSTFNDSWLQSDKHQCSFHPRSRDLFQPVPCSSI